MHLEECLSLDCQGTMLAPVEPAVTITPESLPAKMLLSSLSSIIASQVQKQAFSFVELCATDDCTTLQSTRIS